MEREVDRLSAQTNSPTHAPREKRAFLAERLESDRKLIEVGGDSLTIGDVVTVEGWLARDGSNLANLRVVVLADGRQVFGGSSGGDQK